MDKLATDVDILVVGAGVVGLAIALSLARAGRDVLLVERHTRPGTETSSRNSGVIHAGLYYPPGTRRARLCVAGKQALYRYAAEREIPVVRCGKLIVAATEDEVPRLLAIRETARRNGVDDLTLLSSREVRSLEPALACEAAMLSPSTGVIDTHAYVEALAADLTDAGGTLAVATEVTQISTSREGTFAVTSRSDGGEFATVTARRLVLAAGLGATALGRQLPNRNGYTVPETYPAKGHYFALRGRPPFRHLVYPMPSGAWLGIHLTLDTGGTARFGPDLEWSESVDYAFEDKDGRRRAAFETAIRRYWPALPDGALLEESTGIRPKLYRAGEPARDFEIHGAAEHGVQGAVALYGIESPGLTSSLAIAAEVAAMVESERV